MDKNYTIEKYGSIIKQEELVLVSNINCDNYFIFVSEYSFPGYYSTNIITKNITKPLFYYIITSQEQGLEKIIRLFEDIQQIIVEKIDATKALIEYKNNKYYAIRINRIKNSSVLFEIINYLINNDVEILKSPKDILCINAKITIDKFFNLGEIDGIYFDRNNANFSYFTVPYKLKWEIFEDYTKEIRNNYNFRFDASLGFFYQNSKVKDLIRIFSLNSDIELLFKLRNEYLDKIDDNRKIIKFEQKYI